MQIYQEELVDLNESRTVFKSTKRPIRLQPHGCNVIIPSNVLTGGTTELVQHFSFIGGVDIGARALVDINLI
jgi:hypothetical protein